MVHDNDMTPLVALCPTTVHAPPYLVPWYMRACSQPQLRLGVSRGRARRTGKRRGLAMGGARAQQRVSGW